ncbi:MAG: TrmH family RNA methyltransferase [Desulfuromonas sp.]|nr:TrmH family RNA methyltransferase [Desulfuromonas sp.]
MENTNARPLTVILVEPRQPGNIGATCRAMANFGVTDLRLVNPCDRFAPEAVKFAVAAKPLLGQAQLFTSLSEALADLHVSLALTRRRGRLRGDLPTIAQFPQLLATLPVSSKVGLVFGREDCGLSTQEVACCTHAVSIPTPGDNGSLNLAQAVVVTLYELLAHDQGQACERNDCTAELPAQQDMDALLQKLEGIAATIGYNNPSRPEVIGHTLRQLLSKSQPDIREFNMLRGFVTQLEQSIHGWPGKRRG